MFSTCNIGSVQHGGIFHEPKTSENMPLYHTLWSVINGLFSAVCTLRMLKITYEV